MIEVLNSKIHRAIVQDSDLNYEGSITISSELIYAAKLTEFQKVSVVNINNGNRFDTYVIETNIPGMICVNGAAARLVSKGDLIIIMSYKTVNEEDATAHQPIVVRVDKNNKIVSR